MSFKNLKNIDLASASLWVAIVLCITILLSIMANLYGVLSIDTLATITKAAATIGIISLFAIILAYAAKN